MVLADSNTTEATRRVSAVTVGSEQEADIRVVNVGKTECLMVAERVKA